MPSVLLFEALAERYGDARTRQDWRSIGSSLARLHQVHDVRFGLNLDGFFGPLSQNNAPVTSNRWADFYAERRLVPRLRSAVDSGHLPSGLSTSTEELVRRLPSLCGPEPEPTLLHGDAQQNNFVTTDRGAVLIDPAPYFGHPEVDLALIDYFEAVPADVFDAYREITAIDTDFPLRRELWRVHAYLALITVDGGRPFGRRFLERLAEALQHYR